MICCARYVPRRGGKVQPSKETGSSERRPWPEPAYDAVRTADHLYAEYATGEKELYNLRRDPHQLTSRHASASRTLRSELRARLDALRGCAGEGCERAEDGG